MPSRRTICLDFDGVIHAYRDGWHGGEIYDELTDGCADALRVLDRRSDLVVCTARHNLLDVRSYLHTQGIAHLLRKVDNRKPQAALYVDDRAHRFEGDWDAVIRAARDSYAT